MSPRLALIIHSILIGLDIVLIFIYILQPQRDRVHGGLGQGLFVFYGLGVVVFLLVYEVIFLVLHFKEFFMVTKTLGWILICLNVLIGLKLIHFARLL
jgi:hypothetical protein